MEELRRTGLGWKSGFKRKNSSPLVVYKHAVCRGFVLLCELCFETLSRCAVCLVGTGKQGKWASGNVHELGSVEFWLMES